MNVAIERQLPDGTRKLWVFSITTDTWQPGGSFLLQFVSQKPRTPACEMQTWLSYGLCTPPPGMLPVPPDVIAEAKEKLLAEFRTLLDQGPLLPHEG
jgi:hypothetical protein